MILCFPDPYKDELFYSACARFSERVGYPSRGTVIIELFGNKGSKPVTDLPSHLDKFISALPPESNYTSDYFIDNHTLLPYYGPFLSPERLEKVRSDMRGDRGSAVHMRTGVVGCLVPLPEWLRFCPLCVEDDRKKVGECYWHRVHQVPGVMVCPFHEIFLQDSRVHARNRRIFAQFISAEQAVWPAPIVRLELSNFSHQILHKLANDTAWLLEQHNLSCDVQILQEKYKALFAEHSLATHTGTKVYKSKLIQRFKEYYSTDFLQLLHCEVNDYRNRPWLIRLVHKSPHLQHPLRHLLLIYFLGSTVEEFFSMPLPNKWLPFGNPPWPCLNPVSSHYQQLCVQRCDIAYSKGCINMPMGHFICDCGFIYCRMGPDRLESDRSRYSKVEAFGSVWEMELKRLWECPTISLNQIARKLGVAKGTVKKHAVKLGLSLYRGTHSLSNPTIKRTSKAARISKMERINVYRATYLSALAENPDMKITAPTNKLHHVYAYLRKFDSEWLEVHRPKLRKDPKPGRSHVDWAARDVQYLKAVQDAVIRLTKTSERPIQLTVYEISRDIGLLPSLEAHLNKLPLTAQFLKGVVETQEMVAIRRVWWTATCFRQEQICPTRSQLTKRAGVVGAQAKWVKVREAVDAAMLTLS